ncbi:MAG: PepSY domain-containing protein [Synergistaceae bacterium]|nr:PepSY domain-containing protein [Synergistaceae bacterium]
MRKHYAIILLLLAALTTLCISVQASALTYTDKTEAKYIKKEARRRKIKLVSLSKAKRAAKKAVQNDSGSKKVKFTEMELDNEADDYPNAAGFRPVYTFGCISGGIEYDVDVDALTGQVLKLEEEYNDDDYDHFSGLKDDRESQYVRQEAERRNIQLISTSEAEDIAAGRIRSGSITFKEIELEDEHDDYPNSERFRPVYKIECYSGRDEYDIEIDAVTGKILKFKLDD